MQRRTIKVTVKKDGTYTMEALEGFSGQSCIEKTKQLELILNGTEIAEGKKPEFYEPDDFNAIIDNVLN